MQEEGEAVFAPDGDSVFSGCAIMVMQQYNGATSSDLSMFSENPEILEALLQSYMESSVGEDFSGDMEFKVCEKSPFGMAIKMSMGSDGTKINAYFIFDEEGYMSVMMSLDTEADLPAAQARRRPDPEVRIGRVGVLRGPLGLRDQPAVGIGQPGEGRIVLVIETELLFHNSSCF